MPADDGVVAQLFLGRIPGLAIDDRLVLPGVSLALVDDVTDVDGVRQQLVDMATGEGFTATPLATPRDPPNSLDRYRSGSYVSLSGGRGSVWTPLICV